MLWGSCSPSTRATSCSALSETSETVPSPILPMAATAPEGSSSMCSGSWPSLMVADVLSVARSITDTVSSAVLLTTILPRLCETAT